MTSSSQLPVEVDNVKRRQDRLEDAIEKLTDISADINKMLAVQELRINQQEKSVNDISKSIEDRRKEHEEKIGEVYDHIRDETNKLHDRISSIKSKQEEMQRMIWMYMGGFSVIIFFFTNAGKLTLLFGN